MKKIDLNGLKNVLGPKELKNIKGGSGVMCAWECCYLGGAWGLDCISGFGSCSGPSAEVCEGYSAPCGGDVISSWVEC